MDSTFQVKIKYLQVRNRRGEALLLKRTPNIIIHHRVV
jgi:hypothetical protein